MSGPILLDLYCCQGGAARGYADAGWTVIGVDIDPQPRYPFPFLQMDALEAMQRLVRGEMLSFTRPDRSHLFVHISDICAIHASPPCQAHTKAWKLNKREHPRLIAPTRELLEQARVPYVIENVEEARDDKARRIMGMPWANRDGLREAIPPVYTEYVGRQMLAHIGPVAA